MINGVIAQKLQTPDEILIELRSLGWVNAAALRFETSPSFEQQLALLARLQEALRVDEVDLVVLNDANPVPRFEAISGRSLFCRDRSRCAGFALLTAREYEDAMAFWEHGMRTRSQAHS